MTGPTGLRHIEASHPAHRGEPSPMQTISDRSAGSAPFGADLLPVLAGAALAVSATGAVLVLFDPDSALRAPLALFYLLAAPAEAGAFLLRRLEPLARTAASLSGAVVIDLLTAESMAGLHLWSVRNGVTAVGVISLLLFLHGFLVGTPRGTGVNRAEPDRESPAQITEK
ncbi:hypothetical protein [Streptomyces sp. NBC_00083]|uniref:hypothetical protein n=1 Tax=Streptomyces sp. NBC_00083 TaxID=2975647 RepID=UPI0022527A2D|nr:hypothetical protein [Streptomyces sp. NBC_00083]MCX5383330.1 hypothetical protein [Streptomyces sp. NBC_00083]